LTDFDPFADVPADDTDPAPFEEPAPKKAAPKKAAATVTVSEGGRADITLKGGAGFDVPWIPLGFGSIAEAHASLTNPETQKQLAELFDVVAKANALFAAKVAAVAPSKPSGGSGGAPARPGQEAPAGTPEAPGPDWTYKTGVNSKTGKTWKAWMPPRGSDAQPVWL
jgi:hypothetical protein